MKNFKLLIKLVASLFVSLSIYSCKKHEQHTEKHTNSTNTLNINYPALFVVNGASNNVSVINLSDNTVRDTISLNGAKFPHHIYLNPAKTKLAIGITSTDLSNGHVGHEGHGSTSAGYKVLIIDAVTGNVDKEILVSKMPHNAVYNKTGTELWIGQSDEVQSQILIYNTADWTIQNKINVGKGLSEITFTSEATKAYACNTNEGTITIIDANTKNIDTTIAVGNGPVGAWSASNGRMYVDNEVSQTISEVSNSEMKILNTIHLGFKPGYVAYNSMKEELWVSDATNGKVAYFKLIENIWTLQGKISTGIDAHAILFNKEGSKAYVTNQGDGTVSVIDVHTHSVIKTITVGMKPNGIAIKE